MPVKTENRGRTRGRGRRKMSKYKRKVSGMSLASLKSRWVYLSIYFYDDRSPKNVININAASPRRGMSIMSNNSPTSTFRMKRKENSMNKCIVLLKP